MDHSYPYIASLTREPFLFYEMRSTAKLMAEGNSDDAIVKKNCRAESFPVSNGKIHLTYGKSLHQTASCNRRCFTGFCNCVTANGYSKADLSVCADETEQTGLGIYVDRHWREVQIKRNVFW